MRPPTEIAPSLVAGRHPCAFTAEEAAAAVTGLVDAGVTLFVDLTEDGELEPYAELVPAGVRRISLPVRDLSTPGKEQLVEALDTIDAEIAAVGRVYLHCWAGCGRTGVVAGCWLVRHGTDPHDALARIAETRGPGCPQTLEQRLAILAWQPGE